MPSAEKVFVVPRPIGEVWDFLSNMVNVGSCLPGCEKVEVLNDTESDWTVKVKLGPVSKTIHARSQTTESVPPNRAAFVAESPELHLEGTLDLVAISPQETQVTYRSTARAKGPMEKLLEQIVASRLHGDAEAFADNVRARLAE